MSTARRPQPRRSRRNQQPRPAPGQTLGQAGERHHHVTIDRTNADYWLARMHSFADNARSHGNREGAARLDLLAEDLSACMAADWRDRRGIAVTHWDYHMWITPRPDGLLSVRMQLQPEHLAA